VGKIRRGNLVFVPWIGDHGRRHVHVYRKERLVVKWDLDRGVAMKGRATKKVRAIIAELEMEGPR
jgi:hypothetical protein